MQRRSRHWNTSRCHDQAQPSASRRYCRSTRPTLTRPLWMIDRIASRAHQESGVTRPPYPCPAAKVAVDVRTWPRLPMTDAHRVEVAVVSTETASARVLASKLRAEHVPVSRAVVWGHPASAKSCRVGRPSCWMLGSTWSTATCTMPSPRYDGSGLSSWPRPVQWMWCPAWPLLGRWRDRRRTQGSRHPATGRQGQGGPALVGPGD